MFKFHKLNQIGQDHAVEIQRIFEKALGAIEQAVPAGRELSIVKTKLEEACFFAKKGMAVQAVNQCPAAE